MTLYVLQITRSHLGSRAGDRRASKLLAPASRKQYRFDIPAFVQNARAGAGDSTCLL